MKIVCKVVREGGKMPKYGRDLDAGADIYMPETIPIFDNKINVIPLGIAVHIPQGYVGILVPRTGSLKNDGIVIHNPLIDPGYTGEIHAFISVSNYTIIPAGDRVCSLLIQPMIRAEFVDSIDNNRGDKAFHSSGA